MLRAAICRRFEATAGIEEAVLDADRDLDRAEQQRQPAAGELLAEPAGRIAAAQCPGVLRLDPQDADTALDPRTGRSSTTSIAARTATGVPTEAPPTLAAPVILTSATPSPKTVSAEAIFT